MKKIYFLAVGLLIVTFATIKSKVFSKEVPTAMVVVSSAKPEVEAIEAVRSISEVTPTIQISVKSKSQIDLETMEFELKLDLQEISDRKLIATVNDPLGNAEVRKAAIDFLNNYLRKLSHYMELKALETQRWANQ